eukprot:6182062-Pyramimonas_sp.AAC.2
MYGAYAAGRLRVRTIRMRSVDLRRKQYKIQGLSRQTVATDCSFRPRARQAKGWRDQRLARRSGRARAHSATLLFRRAGAASLGVSVTLVAPSRVAFPRADRRNPRRRLPVRAALRAVRLVRHVPRPLHVPRERPRPRVPVPVRRRRMRRARPLRRGSHLHPLRLGGWVPWRAAGPAEQILPVEGAHADADACGVQGVRRRRQPLLLVKHVTPHPPVAPVR